MTGRIVGVCVAVFVAAALIWLPMHRRPPRTRANVPVTPVARVASTKERKLETLRGSPFGQVTKASFRHNDKDGKPLLEVTGDRVTNHADIDQMHIMGVKATMFQDGKPAARFAAKEVLVSYVKDKERLTFLDDVHIRSELRNAELRAGRVEYELKTKKLVAHDHITLHHDNLQIEANELRADLALDRVVFMGPMEGRILLRRGL